MPAQTPVKSRRIFLQKAALRIGSALALPLITRCSPPDTPGVSETASPTPAQALANTATAVPTQTFQSQAPLTPTQKSTPTAPSAGIRSTLVRVQSPSFWDGDTLSAPLIRQSLDASVTALTGVKDAREAWSALFKPGDRVAIKVNAMLFGATNPVLVSVVTQCLMDIGIPAEKITIYDRTSDELKNAGYALNAAGSGIRCRGTEGAFGEQTGVVSDQPVWVSQMVTECDALINMPVLKGFSFGGISFTLKNHYGSITDPSRFHDPLFAAGVTGINALPAIKGKTRLVIGDILNKETHGDSTDYAVIGGVNTLLVGLDPLTVDAVGLDTAIKVLAGIGKNTRAIEHQVQAWLTAAEGQGLGAGDLNRIEIKEIRV